MTPERMRIATPCSENLDAMEKTERGFFCDKCQHDVVDLRRAPKKKALAVLSDLRARASAAGSARVCVRVMARGGVPVFAADPPSAFARYAAPIALATSLAACSPTTSAHGTTPVVLVQRPEGEPPAPNGNGRVVTTPIVVGVVSGNPQTPPTGVISYDPMVDVAGGMAFEGP